MSTLVSLRNITKTYQRGPEKVQVLHGIDLDIASGDFVALMGPSGSGKTTLLNLIGGLDNPSGGEISIEGERIDQMSGGQLSTWRSHHVGFVFQFYNLMPMLTAQKNVELPLLLTHLNAAQRRRNAEIALTLVGLADRRSHRPNELSGGQQQRVAIARAIVSDPTFLICDEPTGDLDRQSAEEILGLLQQLNREHGKTIIMVTHDPKAAEYATHTVHLDKGELATRRWPTDGGHGDEILLVGLGAAVPQPHAHVADPAVGGGRVPAVRHARFGARGVHLRRQRGRRQPPGGGLAAVDHPVAADPPGSPDRQVAGVRDVAYGMWFGGIYQDPKNFFPNFSVSPNYFDVYRELQIDPAQLEDWKQTRTGAIVGETLAKQFGWKIGDTIPLQATIFPRGGSNDWPLVLKGIYRSKDRALAANEERQLMMNWKYFDESNDYIKNQVSWYTVTLDNPTTPRGWRRRSTRSRPTPTTRPRPRPNRRSSRPSSSSSPTSA
jgi:putative ABC transport system ATP-binding protein